MRRPLVRAATVTAVAVVTVVAATALAGCRSTGGGSASGGAKPTTSLTVPPQECPFVSGATLARDVVDTEVVQQSSGPGGCVFTGPRGLTVTLSATTVGVDPEILADGTRQVCQGDIVEVDAGDSAFACQAAVAVRGFVFSGDRVVSIEVDDTTDDAAALRIATEALPLLRLG